MATSKTRDKTVGKAQEAKGRMKAASGALTGKGGEQLKGEVTAAKGKVTKKKGQLKDRAD